MDNGHGTNTKYMYQKFVFEVDFTVLNKKRERVRIKFDIIVVFRSLRSGCVDELCQWRMLQKIGQTMA